ncbi:MAG: alpha/beta hydrolase-fold protein [Candidatus Sericytochromatia bacterium]|nr:alpha/beta hydrolase-fold protein [Candidatus Sericytochromatia bacterium]
MKRTPMALAASLMTLATLTGCGTPALATLSTRPLAPADRSLQALSGPGRASGWVTPPARSTLVTHRTFRSAAARAEVSYHLYLPPAYQTQRTRRFPVLYWLHGTDGGLSGVPKLAARFDAAIRAGQMPPTIVVFPNGRVAGMWVDSKDGATPVETMLVRELLPLIDRTCRTIASRDGRILEGFSMGGYGAGRVGLSHPDKFGRVSMLAGGPLDLAFEGPRAQANPEGRDRILKAVYGGDLSWFQAVSPWRIAQRQARVVAGRTRLRVAVGEADFTFASNAAFHDHLQALRIPHQYTTHPGVKHDTMALLEALGEAGWAFYR